MGFSCGKLPFENFRFVESNSEYKSIKNGSRKLRTIFSWNFPIFTVQLLQNCGNVSVNLCKIATNLKPLNWWNTKQLFVSSLSAGLWQPQGLSLLYSLLNQSVQKLMNKINRWVCCIYSFVKCVDYTSFYLNSRTALSHVWFGSPFETSIHHGKIQRSSDK